MSSALSEAEVERYCRQIVIPEIGAKGQERLATSRVTVVGLGPLGATTATYLALAGVGELGLADSRAVSDRDLGGGFIYEAADAGRPRLAAALARIAALARTTRLHAVSFPPDSQEAVGLDLLIDASDDIEAAQQTDAACMAAGIPHLWVEANGAGGRLALFAGHHSGTACLRCVLPPEPRPAVEDPESPLGFALLTALGALAAVEGLKACLGIGRTLAGRELRLDGNSGALSEARLAKKPGCAGCVAVGGR